MMKTTIEMAREAAGDDWGLFQEYMPEIHRLTELVRADERNRTWTQEHWTEYERSIVEAEREACAKLCDIEASVTVTNAEEQYQEGRSMGAAVCAAAIRERSNT